MSISFNDVLNYVFILFVVDLFANRIKSNKRRWKIFKKLK